MLNLQRHYNHGLFVSKKKYPLAWKNYCCKRKPLGRMFYPLFSQGGLFQTSLRSDKTTTPLPYDQEKQISLSGFWSREFRAILRIETSRLGISWTHFLKICLKSIIFNNSDFSSNTRMIFTLLEYQLLNFMRNTYILIHFNPFCNLKSR